MRTSITPLSLNDVREKSITRIVKLKALDCKPKRYEAKSLAQSESERVRYFCGYSTDNCYAFEPNKVY